MPNDALTTDPLLEAEAWPATQPGLYRSEAFPEDLELGRSPEPVPGAPVKRSAAVVGRAAWFGLGLRPG